MTHQPRIALAMTLALMAASRWDASAAQRANLVKNADFERAGADPSRPADFNVSGDVARRYAGTAYEFSSMGVALDSGKDLDGDGAHQGSVSQDVLIDATLPGRWFRFTIRGLPEDGFAVLEDQVYLKADFCADRGKRALDAVTRKFYAQIEQERRDLGANGVGKRGGAATWKSYGFEFALPFPEVDMVRISVGFRRGAGQGGRASFWVDEISLEAIPTPADAPKTNVRPTGSTAVDVARLVPLGGRWFYQPADSEKPPNGGNGLVVNARNAGRLFYRDGGRHVNPFAENMSAWLRKGYLDLAGELVEEDRFQPDNVTIRFGGPAMIVRAHNLPNHPTAIFPSPPGSGDRNPSYIQEHDYTYTIPLDPKRDPGARAMDRGNSNRALPVGAIGIAVNGVVFYNPFDAGMTDATDLMDRCCGHPSPDNRYHYHKYPVCVKSPFSDEGLEHSPLIGWAFDGFAIYGPYEARGVMAKDSKDNPLNAFNVHRDLERGWHYHVTPGKFPYIIGGYWGKRDARTGEGPGRAGPMAGRGPGGPGRLMRGPGQEGGRGGPGRPMPGPGQGGPGGFRPPPHPVMLVLDRDGNGVLSPEEIAGASGALMSLDRDGDGTLSDDELRPPPPPGGFGPGGPP
jgi:YHYH protein